MTSPETRDLLIRVVPPGEAPEALRMVFGAEGPEACARQVEPILEEAAAGRLSLVGVLEGRRGEQRVGAVFSQIQPGKTAIIWAPACLPEEPPSTTQELLEAACGVVRTEGVEIAYTLLPSVSDPERGLWQGAGFELLAKLLYMVSLSSAFPAEKPESPLVFEPYEPASHDRLVRVVEATYEDTLDCPRVNNLRKTDDVLAGYRATGVFDPSRWLIVTHRGRDVGCLLLADHAKQENWELVYMGLVASARGRTWGRQIAKHAQWLAACAGRPRLVLAVDASNTPAIDMYRAVGFESWDYRHVYFREIRGQRADKP